ncbi:MAG: tRNA guanosine(34) transglycosylase Tgt, partial [Planctomycetes bacterium]|nr:tRNA guanosine(34) transglycosylase Tgt [Planctomycetota bacterium]
YIRHLCMAGEMLGMTLLSIHNLTFYTLLMRKARAAIVHGQFSQFIEEWLPRVSGAAE